MLAHLMQSDLQETMFLKQGSFLKDLVPIPSKKGIPSDETLGILKIVFKNVKNKQIIFFLHFYFHTFIIAESQFRPFSLYSICI